MCIIRSNVYLSALNEITDITDTEGDNTADSENIDTTSRLCCVMAYYTLIYYVTMPYLTTTLIVKFSIPNKLKIIV